MAKLVIQWGLVVLVAGAALVWTAVGLGVLAHGNVIAFNIVDEGTDAPREIFLIDVNTRVQRVIGLKDFWFQDDLIVANDNFHPVYSPDGRQIAFVNYEYEPQMDIRPEGSYVCVMNADGTSPRCLVDGHDPVWVALDGTLLAYISNGTLYVRNMDTGETFNPTNHEVDEFFIDEQFGPIWSSQNNLIVFTWRDDDSSGEIYTVEPDGSNLRNLTHYEAHDFNPVWSPDGQKIIFASQREGTTQLYIMNADGTDVRQITEGSTEVYYARWSPDGAQIAYAAHSSGAAWSEILVVNADGTNRRWLAEANYPSWSPDGSQIAFVSPQDRQIYIINRDLSGLYRLTDTIAPVDHYPPAWRP